MTAYGTTENAIEATKMGAFDYILKPFEIPDMLAVVQQALEANRFMRTPVSLDVTPDQASGEAIIGRSKPMQEVYKAIGRVSSADATVLIRGESGTGKELVARAIYQHSLRAEKPFLVINCVAIPENLLESELFGYEKGAFTGAAHRRVGKIEQAGRGTVFLDEIGDMPFSIQAKILRLLQEKSIERLGGRETIPVDVRIIAATNRDLEAALAEGRFREDLYYRLKVVTIHLPPLRERLSDIPLLAKYFLSHFTAELDMNNPGITEEALAALNQHHWPGNVRELANALQKALIFNRGAPIHTEEIRQAISGESVARGPQADTPYQGIRQWVRGMMTSEEQKNRYDTIMNRFASILVSEALNMTDGNRTRAARLLGLSRPTLHSKIEKYGLKLKTSVDEKHPPKP
jgi:DNA-binding NtrC family response regulator